MTSEEKLDALNRLLEHCRRSPFYRERLPDRPLRSLKELKDLPLLTKDDLRKHSPFGLLCVPRSELYQYNETFGTTGIPVSNWLTKEDLKTSARAIIKNCGINFNEDDIVLVRFPYAISAIAHIITAAAHLKQACVIPASSRSTVSPFPRIVDLMRRLEVTVLAGLPLQALLIAETAELLGLDPTIDFPHLRGICTAGETLPPGRRKLLEETWGAPVYDNYGMTEIGPAVLDCEFGRSHPVEDSFIFEILDEELKNEVKAGEIGYLVITTLKRRATPSIRYVTGDRARLVRNECPCGKEECIEVHGRKEYTVSVGERLLDLWDLDEIVSRLPLRRYWVVGLTPGGLHFVIEEEKDISDIPSELLSELEKKYEMKLRIDVVPRGTLCDRGELLALGVVGKPRYIYTAQEMAEKKYVKSSKI